MEGRSDLQKFEKYERLSEKGDVRNLFEVVPALISQWDVNFFNLAANNFFTTVFGKRPEDLLGTHISELIGAAAFEKARSHLLRAIAGTTQTFEAEIAIGDGSQRIFQITAGGQTLGSPEMTLCLLLVDVTEQRDMAFRLEQMTNAVEEVFWMTDFAKSKMIYISPGYEKIWGRSCESLYESPLSFVEAIHPEDRDRVLSAFSKQAEGAYNETYRIIRADGATRWVRDRAYPVKAADGQVTKVVGVARDVTDLVEQQAALDFERAKSVQNAKLASIGELSAGIAHEINNPLAIILGSVLLLEKHRDNPEKYAAKIEAINRSIGRITKIVNGLRRFSRVNEQPIYKPVVCADIVRESLVLTEGKAKRQRVPITVDLRSEGKISCDQVEIEQVLINLINNAVDVIKDLAVRWVKIDLFEQGAEIVIQVRDSGQGVAPSMQQKIFQPFFTTKAVGEGTGLGLSICRGILEEHNASLEIKQEDANTCFEIRFAKLSES